MTDLTHVIAPTAFRMHISKRVQILPVPPVTQIRTGTIRFSGSTDFAEGAWVGVELDCEYEGKNSGTVQGVEYFRVTNPGQGIFVRPELVQLMPEAGMVAVELRGEIDVLQSKLTEAAQREQRLAEQVELARVEVEIAREEKLMLQDEIEFGVASASASPSPSSSSSAQKLCDKLQAQVEELQSRLAEGASTKSKNNAILSEDSAAATLQSVEQSKQAAEAELDQARVRERRAQADAKEFAILCDMQAEELERQQEQIVEMEKVQAAKLCAANELLRRAQLEAEEMKRRTARAEQAAAKLSKSDGDKGQLLEAASAVVAVAKSSAARVEQERELERQMFEICNSKNGSSSRNNGVLEHLFALANQKKKGGDYDDDDKGDTQMIVPSSSLVPKPLRSAQVRCIRLGTVEKVQELLGIALENLSNNNNNKNPAARVQEYLLLLLSFRVGILPREEEDDAVEDDDEKESSAHERMLAVAREIVLLTASSSSQHHSSLSSDGDNGTAAIANDDGDDELSLRLKCLEEKTRALAQHFCCAIAPSSLTSPQRHPILHSCFGLLYRFFATILERCAEIAVQVKARAAASGVDDDSGERVAAKCDELVSECISAQARLPRFSPPPPPPAAAAAAAAPAMFYSVPSSAIETLAQAAASTVSLFDELSSHLQHDDDEELAKWAEAMKITSVRSTSCGGSAPVTELVWNFIFFPGAKKVAPAHHQHSEEVMSATGAVPLALSAVARSWPVVVRDAEDIKEAEADDGDVLTTQRYLFGKRNLNRNIGQILGLGEFKQNTEQPSSLGESAVVGQLQKQVEELRCENNKLKTSAERQALLERELVAEKRAHEVCKKKLAATEKEAGEALAAAKAELRALKK